MAKRGVLIVIIVVLWAMFLGVTIVGYLTHPLGGGDFPAYYKAAVALLRGQPMYTEVYGETPYLYPPLLAILLTPTAALTDLTGSKIVWLIVNVGLLLALTALTVRALPGSPRWQTLVWLMPVFYMPVFMSLWIGQATVIMFACMTGAWLAWRANRPGVAGVLLALGAWVKIYALALIAYAAWKRDWRTVRAAAVSGMLLGVLQLLIAGMPNTFTYVTYILPQLATSGQAHLYHSNVSLVGLAAKLFLRTAYIQAPLVESVTLFNVARVGLIVSLILATLYAVSRPLKIAQTTPARRDLEVALVVTASLLVTTSLAASGMISLLIVFALLLRAPSSVPSRRRIRLWCLLAFVLGSLESFLFFGYLDTPDKLVPLPVMVTSTASMLILWGMMLTLLLGRRIDAAR